MNDKGILLGLAVAEPHRDVQLVRPGASAAGRSKRSGMRSCSPGRHADLLAARHSLGQAERPFALGGNGLAGVVDDDDLFLDRFARQEVVVLAGEAGRLAADVGQQRPVVADQRLRRGRGDPVRALEGQVHPLVALLRCSPG